MFWPPPSRTMKYDFLPAVGIALPYQLWVRSFHLLWVRSFHLLWVRSFRLLSPGSSDAESADFSRVFVGAVAAA